MQEKHTPGQWIAIKGVDDEPDRWAVYTKEPRHYHIATIENGAPGDTLDTEQANARLIAAAPALVEALTLAYHCLYGATQDSYYDAAKATIWEALVQAKGGA